MNTTGFKKIVAAFALSVFSLAYAGAQIVDNIANAALSSSTITSTGWSGNAFRTANTTYSLTSITLDMFTAGNASGNFQVQLWSAGASQPGSSLATLVGNANPATANTYSYTPSSTVTLSPLTTYWVVAKVTSGAGSYQWNFTSDTSFTGSGTLGGSSDSSNSGVAWTSENTAVPNQFSVTGTAVPEPSAYAAVFGVAALGFGVFSRRFRRA